MPVASVASELLVGMTAVNLPVSCIAASVTRETVYMNACMYAWVLYCVQKLLELLAYVCVRV